MGRKGGQKASERWNDRNSDYAQAETEKLAKANLQRGTGGRVTARRIANYFDDTMLQTGSYPSIPDAMEEFGVSRPTVNGTLKKAGISLPRGRRKGNRVLLTACPIYLNDRRHPRGSIPAVRSARQCPTQCTV